jgi:uncharacterized protein YggE
MSKQRLIIWGICLLLTVLTVSPVAASTPANANSITVTGHAETAVSPDIAYISTGIVTVGQDIESARLENNRTMSRIIEALVQQNIPREQIKTTSFAIQPTYNYNAPQPEREITGYRVENIISLSVTDLDRIGYIIDAAAKAGANHFGNIRFGVKDEASLQGQLLQQAVSDGQSKARIIATALGSSLGQPLTVTETGRFTPVLYEQSRQFALKANVSSPTPVNAGLITASIDLNMVFALR